METTMSMRSDFFRRREIERFSKTVISHREERIEQLEELLEADHDCHHSPDDSCDCLINRMKWQAELKVLKSARV